MYQIHQLYQFTFNPIQHKAIIWINAGLLSIGPLWTNFSDHFQ